MKDGDKSRKSAWEQAKEGLNEALQRVSQAKERYDNVHRAIEEARNDREELLKTLKALLQKPDTEAKAALEQKKEELQGRLEAFERQYF